MSNVGQSACRGIDRPAIPYVGGSWSHPTQAKVGLEWATVVLRFTQQKVNVVRHDYVSVNVEFVIASHSF